MNKGLITFGLTIAISIAASLQTLARGLSERYPTDIELQELKAKLHQQIETHQIPDLRTSQEKKTRESLVKAWSRVNPGVAPFLGSWRGSAENLAIYPTKTKGLVCVVYLSVPELSLSFGTVVNELIVTNQRELILKEKNYLGVARVNNNQANIVAAMPYHSPKPLQPVRELVLSSGMNPYQMGELVQKFHAVGCMAGLPSR